MEMAIKRSQEILQGLLDLIFPPYCAVCKRSGQILCAACLAQIRPLQEPYCMHCNTRLLAAGLCRRCQYQPLHLSGIRAASDYQGPLRTCIHAFKYEGKTRLAEVLGGLLVETFKRHKIQADLLIPVPLHQKRQQQRGYNQAQLLAEVCTKQLNLPLYNKVLTRIRATTSQVQLPAHERQHNMAGAFVCNPMQKTGTLRGKSILLIDDVCTTGATLEECAVPLFAAGARAVWGLVLARPT